MFKFDKFESLTTWIVLKVLTNILVSGGQLRCFLAQLFTLLPICSGYNGTTHWCRLTFYVCTQNFCTESVSLVQAHNFRDLSFLMVHQRYQSWWLFSGEECQREDIEGKLHILMGTIAVSKIPGNPNICSGCFHKSTEFFNMWQKATIGISEYIEVIIWVSTREFPRQDKRYKWLFCIHFST